MAGEFGLVLRKARRDAGLTQKELAFAIGKDHAEVCRWEDGENIPHRDTVIKLAQVLEVKAVLFTTIIRWEKEHRRTGYCEEAAKFLASYMMNI